MGDIWLELLDHLLRPARPGLDRCLRERENHLAARRPIIERRLRAIARCERRINEARAAAFAAGDGVVTARMTDLEREWRTLSRQDPDNGLMDLWARIAPPSWIDRKRWRDSAPAARLDAAIALAADAENVDAAEAAIARLRPGARVRWRLFEQDDECVAALLASPLAVAQEACPPEHRGMIEARARRVEARLHAEATTRLPHRPNLARDFAHAAYFDCVWRASELDGAANPIAALRALWKTGYVISAIDDSLVTLEIPPL